MVDSHINAPEESRKALPIFRCGGLGYRRSGIASGPIGLFPRRRAGGCVRGRRGGERPADEEGAAGEDGVEEGGGDAEEAVREARAARRGVMPGLRHLR
jgi:hypothetical protein